MKGRRHGRMDDAAPVLSVVDGAPGRSPVDAGIPAARGARARRLTLADCGDVLSLREVCAVLGIGQSTWRGWRRDLQAPIAELEPRTYHPRYAKVDVERYLANPRKASPWQRRLMGVAS
jgi:hypothetical protein